MFFVFVCFFFFFFCFFFGGGGGGGEESRVVHQMDEKLVFAAELLSSVYVVFLMRWMLLHSSVLPQDVQSKSSKTKRADTRGVSAV